jgi:hypothetical protein
VSGPARLRVQILRENLVVHEFTRSTSQPTADGVARMLGAALGWMQAYQGALNEGQWQADVTKAQTAQAQAEKQPDGSSVVSAPTSSC